MAVDPQVYDDKLLEIINSLQIPPSLEEQLGIGSMDLLAPSWNLPGGPEGGIYPLMPGMEYAPSMASSYRSVLMPRVLSEGKRGFGFILD